MAHWAGIFFPWLPKKLKSIQLKTFSLMWTQWGKGRGGWIGRGAMTYIHYHVWNRWPVRSGCTHGKHNSVLCDDPDRWDGDGRERGLRGRRHMYTYNWSNLLYSRNLRQYCKAVILQENTKTKTLYLRVSRLFPLLEIHWQKTHKISVLFAFRYQMKPLTFVFNHWNLKTIAVLSMGWPFLYILQGK